MDCDRFVEIVDAFEQGNLPDRARVAAEGHLAACDRCQLLLTALRGTRETLPGEEASRLASEVLHRTSGDICPRVLDAASSDRDGELDRTTRELVAGHLASCRECRAIVDAVKYARSVLPELAEADPGELFTREVLGVTSGRERPVFDRVRLWWRAAVARPRFAWEAAYVATVMLTLVVRDPATVISRLPAASFEVAQAGIGRSMEQAADNLGARAQQVISAPVTESVRQQAARLSSDSFGIWRTTVSMARAVVRWMQTVSEQARRVFLKVLDWVRSWVDERFGLVRLADWIGTNGRDAHDRSPATQTEPTRSTAR